MGKIVDITDKLNFEERPKIKIKKDILEVNADATTVLKIMQTIENENVSPKDIVFMYELLFDDATRKKIDKLNLMFGDFQTLVMETIELITGSEGEEGE